MSRRRRPARTDRIWSPGTSPGGYEHGCDDTRDACDQQDPEHQLRGVHAADFRVRRHEVIAVLVHDVIGIEPAAAAMVAGAALVQRHLVIGERAGVQIVDRQQRLLLLALRMLLEAPRVARALDVLQVVGMLRGEGGQSRSSPALEPVSCPSCPARGVVFGCSSPALVSLWLLS